MIYPQFSLFVHEKWQPKNAATNFGIKINTYLCASLNEGD